MQDAQRFFELLYSGFGRQERALRFLVAVPGPQEQALENRSVCILPVTGTGVNLEGNQQTCGSEPHSEPHRGSPAVDLFVGPQAAKRPVNMRLGATWRLISVDLFGRSTAGQ